MSQDCKLAPTCEFSNPNSEIHDQFIDKCSSNRLRRRLLQEPNLTLENVVEKAQAIELAEIQSIAMQPDEMQAGMARLKVTQDKYDFPSNKCCFRCVSSTHLANKCNIAKGKACQKCGKVGHFAAVCKSKPQNLPVNLLRNENPSDDEYCFTISSPLAKTTFTLNNALPVEFLIDSGSSVNIINRNTFEKLESLMSLTRERSCVHIHMVAKLLYLQLESVFLAFVPTAPTRELSQHFMSLTLKHHVFMKSTSE